MPVVAYMIFNGNCREAVDYYSDVFGTEKPEIMKFGDMPPEDGYVLPEDAKDLVMHTAFDVHGSQVMFSDAMPGSKVTFGKNINLTVVADDLDKMTAEFDRLAQDGKVIMPLEKTFWSPAYGALEDKFGVNWQFSYDDGSYTGN
ncbi:VOC family protein [Planococcus sp. N028]|uniref:VOC family protein n=1 Tax=Planococcus shixiaomingii TaxID=3058393 RepID=A0ABT8N4F0_9BACL|nr:MULTISPECIES: VOC family protein [unclassified Planococcus (in: firmicutes)]MDN7242760.1 VOC family protein [Planococcus sp. N028]WKA55614.1 VOC family protein [Planococcus sp. N022]